MNKKYKAVLGILISITFVATVYWGIRFLNHEHRQNERIALLETQIALV